MLNLTATKCCSKCFGAAIPFTSLSQWKRSRRLIKLINGAQFQEPSSTTAGEGEGLYPSSSPSRSLSTCLSIDRTLFCGEIVEHDGSVKVKGNVNSGAAIHANGDIVVLGQLDGEAHAGKNGDAHAVICACQLNSKALSIAGRDLAKLACDSGVFCMVSLLPADEDRARGIRADAKRLDNEDRSWFAIDLASIRKSTKVAFFTGSYILVIGIALLLFPERLFGVFFSLQSSIKEWIRVGAVLAVAFGVYYIGTAWGDAKGYIGAQSFYMSTVVGRVFIFLCFSWLAASGAGGFPLFVVGAVNLFGALTMLNALRTDS